MIPSAYDTVITSLIEKTDLGELKWQELSDRTYALKKPKSTIEIGYYRDDDAELSYYFFNFNNLETKNSAGFRVSSDEVSYKTMETLYTIASASANDIKNELDNFLKDL